MKIQHYRQKHMQHLKSMLHIAKPDNYALTETRANMCCEIYAKFTRNQCAPRLLAMPPPRANSGQVAHHSIRQVSEVMSTYIAVLSRRMLTERLKKTAPWIWEDQRAPRLFGSPKKRRIFHCSYSTTVATVPSRITAFQVSEVI